MGETNYPKQASKQLVPRNDKLTAVKDFKAHVKLIPGSQLMFCKARKIPLSLQYSAMETLEMMERQESWSQGHQGVPNAFPVVWKRKKNGALRQCLQLKVYINGKVMDKGYPIPDLETKYHNLHRDS